MRLTRGSPLAKAEELAEASLLTLEEASQALENLQARGLVGGDFKVSPYQRVQLVLEAVRLGVPLERACRSLSWGEFEETVKNALELNGYEAIHHLRIRIGGRLSEIDVFAVKGELALLLDCKHWRRPLSPSQLRRVVEAQVERLEALKDEENLKVLRLKLGRKNYRKFYVIPVVVTLLEASHRLVEGVPVVPISRLPSFLAEAPTHFHQLKWVRIE